MTEQYEHAKRHDLIKRGMSLHETVEAIFRNENGASVAFALAASLAVRCLDEQALDEKLASLREGALLIHEAWAVKNVG